MDTNNGKPYGNESNKTKKSNVQTDHNIADEIQDNAQINTVDDVASEQVSPNTPSNNHRVTAKPCVVMVGDSMIKHVDPKKLSKKKVYKYTYPGETAESISAKISTLNAQIQPSHVIFTSELTTSLFLTCTSAMLVVRYKRIFYQFYCGHQP